LLLSFKNSHLDQCLSIKLKTINNNLNFLLNVSKNLSLSQKIVASNHTKQLSLGDLFPYDFWKILSKLYFQYWTYLGIRPKVSLFVEFGLNLLILLDYTGLGVGWILLKRPPMASHTGKTVAPIRETKNFLKMARKSSMILRRGLTSQT